MRGFWMMAAAGLVAASTVCAADLEQGKKIFEDKCMSCHGADGKGSAKMSEMLKVKVADLTASHKSDAEILQLLTEGKKPMPSFGKRLSKEEMHAVAEYAKHFRQASK